MAAEPNPFAISTFNATKAAWNAKHDPARAWCQFTAARDRGELAPSMRAAKDSLFPPAQVDEEDPYAWVDQWERDQEALAREQDANIEKSRARGWLQQESRGQTGGI